MMKGNEVLALICKAQNAEHFTEFSAKVLGGIIYLRAGWYTMQPNIATLRSGNFKNAVFLTVNVMENIAFFYDAASKSKL